MKKLAGIDYLEINPEEKQTIVILHGYGADCTDLKPIGDIIKTKTKYRWIFLNAPNTLIIDEGMTGRAWFEIDGLELTKIMLSGDFAAFTESVPPGLKAIRQQLLDFLKQLNVPMESIILGGFSQGAMVTLDVVLNSQFTPKAMILFSAALINKHEWVQNAALKKGLKYFQSHGQLDPLLRHDVAVQLNQVLDTAGLVGNLHTFKGTHEIPPPVLQECGRFIDSLN